MHCRIEKSQKGFPPKRSETEWPKNSAWSSLVGLPHTDAPFPPRILLFTLISLAIFGRVFPCPNPASDPRNVWHEGSTKVVCCHTGTLQWLLSDIVTWIAPICGSNPLRLCPVYKLQTHERSVCAALNLRVRVLILPSAFERSLRVPL